MNNQHGHDQISQLSHADKICSFILKVDNRNNIAYRQKDLHEMEFLKFSVVFLFFLTLLVLDPNSTRMHND